MKLSILALIVVAAIFQPAYAEKLSSSDKIPEFGDNAKQILRAQRIEREAKKKRAQAARMAQLAAKKRAATISVNHTVEYDGNTEFGAANARKKLYEFAASECELILAGKSGTCSMKSVRITDSRNRKITALTAQIQFVVEWNN